MAIPSVKDTSPRLDEWSPRLLKSRLYQRILVDIIIGALAPNEQLDEGALSKRYGGGLAGIREALARLALEGLVVRRARVGTSVAPLDLVGAREAFEARRLIEVHCAGLAAEHASDEDIAAIRATLDEGEDAIRDNDQAALAARRAAAARPEPRAVAATNAIARSATLRFIPAPAGQPPRHLRAAGAP